MSVFVQSIDTYKRDYDIVGNYKMSMSKAVSLAYNVPYMVAKEWLAEKMEDKWKPVSPVMQVLSREPMGDRSKNKTDLLTYLDFVQDTNSILAPNLVAYADRKREESFLSGFIAGNLKNRSKVKKEGQSAKAAGNEEHAIFCNLLQANFKIRNNSISGALSSPYNPLYYASSHTALTSVCRAITSYANACNEKLLASNRHFYSAEIAMENIAYVASHADITLIKETMQIFNIVPPSNEYLFEMTLKCTRLYWQSEEQEKIIYQMLCNLTPYEKAAYAFCGDMHSLQVTNDNVMRVMYSKLMRKPKPILDVEEQDAIKDLASDDDLSLATIMTSDFTKGKRITDLSEVERGVWVGYLEQRREVFIEYSLLVKAFLASPIMPASIHSLPTIIRKCVVGSDTDSSIYSTQKQVVWFTGKNDFSLKAIQVGAISSYIASQHIVHVLASLSGQMNTGEEQLFRLSMKPEFFSYAMANVSIAKHYFMNTAACEGSVYKEAEMDAKGVNLKSSKLPSQIRAEIEKFQWYLLSLPAKEKKVSPMEPVAIIAMIEHKITERLLEGDIAYFKTEQIKTPETYASPTDTKTVSCNLWNKVFAPDHGLIEQLPADCLKVNTYMSKMALVKEWASTLGPTKERLIMDFTTEWGRTNINQILVPLDNIENGRIPKEILSAMDLRKMLYSLVQPFYIMSTSTQLNIANSKLTHLWSDDLTYEEAEKWVPLDYKIEI